LQISIDNGLVSALFTLKRRFNPFCHPKENL
jgi:hypothetical protein